MKDISEITDFFLNIYHKVIDSDNDTSQFFPVFCNLGRIEKNSFNDHLISQLKEHFHDIDGIRIIYTSFDDSEDVPSQIEIKSWSVLLKYLSKRNEYEAYLKNRMYILTYFPALLKWTKINYNTIVMEDGNWEDILKVCQFIYIRYDILKINDPRFPFAHKETLSSFRDLPLTLKNPFIENKKNLIEKILEAILPKNKIDYTSNNFFIKFGLFIPDRRIHFRILDDAINNSSFLNCKDLTIPLKDFNTLESHFQSITNILIIEKEIPFYTTNNLNNTISILRNGYDIRYLNQIKWFHKFNIYYWGNIELLNYKILSHFREFFPKTKSILMDKSTLTSFKHFIEIDLNKESFDEGLLTIEEKGAIELIYNESNHQKIDQEKIPNQYALIKLKEEMGLFS
jgi:hypothetical protein